MTLEQAPIQRGQPLREAVYRRVIALISSGDYSPGTALTEAAISRSLEVSRTPVREALIRLEAEGVLQSSLARGFVVRPLTRSEAGEIYPILGALESLALTTSGATTESSLGDLRAVASELSECDDPVRRWQLDSHWHDLLTATSGNAKLVEMAQSLRTSISRYELTYMRLVRSRAEADAQHRAILDALADGDRERAADIVRRHWRDGLEQVLRWLMRDDRPA